MVSDTCVPGALRRLRVNFSERYPLSPPEVFFIPPTPVRAHVPCPPYGDEMCTMETASTP